MKIIRQKKIYNIINRVKIAISFNSDYGRSAQGHELLIKKAKKK